MKKHLAFLLLAVMLLAMLPGCGGAPAKTAAEPNPSEAAVPAPSDEAAPTAEPTPTPEPEDPLPDVDINSWEFIIANRWNYIGRYEYPSGGISSQGLDGRIVDTTLAMINDAAAAGYTLLVSAAGRGFDFYENHYMAIIDETGMSALEALELTDAGGCSDHNTGLGIDFTDDKAYFIDYEFTPDPDFYLTDAFQWLMEHCADYGFIQRYPEGKEEFYGRACCPQHFRYVGVEAARYIMDHGLCLEEFVALYK